MSPLEFLLIALAGFWAGMINTIVGSGTLVTFPTLLFLGYPAVTANVSNSLGLVLGGLTGTWGYRRELRGLKDLLVRLAPASVAGAVLGALLLLLLPSSAFEAIVPALVGLGVLLVIFGPRLNAWAKSQHAEALTPGRWVALILGTLLAGTYGGYFGAAQGIILMGVLGVLLPLDIQRMNGLKNVLVTLVNLVGVAVFLLVDASRIDWWAAAAVGAGAFLGGIAGARVGRRLPPWLLRTAIVVIGLVAIVYLLAR